MSEKPVVENAPGLTWRKRENEWVALWRARTDIVKKGYAIKNYEVWSGEEVTPIAAAIISDKCTSLQNEMLVWARGGVTNAVEYQGTIKSLIECFMTDPDSTFPKLRYQTRVNHKMFLVRIMKRHGHELLSQLEIRDILHWHREWSDGGTKIAAGHAFVGHLRTLFSFGKRFLKCASCRVLSADMHETRFPMPKERKVHMTADQAIALRNKARECGYFSMALAQALQFELMLRQKDVIGEWVPVKEPGVSDVYGKLGKWITGLRWNEIDENLILTHNTSKRGKDLRVDLKNAPMVLEEFEYVKAFHGKLPASGPMVISETTGRPWTTDNFRRRWRAMATMCGIPKEIRSMDSRSGGISEATDAGADLEHVRHAATHSDISMTQRYSRNSAEKIENVQKLRLAHRNKTRTE